MTRKKILLIFLVLQCTLSRSYLLECQTLKDTVYYENLKSKYFIEGFIKPGLLSGYFLGYGFNIEKFFHKNMKIGFGISDLLIYNPFPTPCPIRDCGYVYSSSFLKILEMSLILNWSFYKWKYGFLDLTSNYSILFQYYYRKTIKDHEGNTQEETINKKMHYYGILSIPPQLGFASYLKINENFYFKLNPIIITIPTFDLSIIRIGYILLLGLNYNL